MAVQWSRGRRAAVGAAAVLLLWPVAASGAWASTGPAVGSDRAAAVQAVLDRVLGPGGATVVVSDTIQTSSSTSTSVHYGSGVVGAIATNRIVSPGGTATASTQQDLVGGTTTAVATPAGALVSETVAVAVDRSRLGSTNLATLRRLVSAAAGVVGSRGDRVSIAVVRFTRPAPVVSPSPSLVSTLLPDAVPALWGLGAIAALLVLLRAVRGGRRRPRLPARPGRGPDAGRSLEARPHLGGS